MAGVIATVIVLLVLATVYFSGYSRGRDRQELEMAKLDTHVRALEAAQRINLHAWNTAVAMHEEAQRQASGIGSHVLHQGRPDR